MCAIRDPQLHDVRGVPETPTKKPACAGFFVNSDVAQAYARSRIFAFRRLLWRAALFLWIKPRAA
jgi:hypothetical protein